MVIFVIIGHPSQFFEACQAERKEKGDGLIPRMFLTCSKPVFLTAEEITSVKETVCSLKNILYVIYKTHSNARTYTLSSDAAIKYGVYFTEFRQTVQLATKKDPCIR